MKPLVGLSGSPTAGAGVIPFVGVELSLAFFCTLLAPHPLLELVPYRRNLVEGHVGDTHVLPQDFGDYLLK